MNTKTIFLATVSASALAGCDPTPIRECDPLNPPPFYVSSDCPAPAGGEGDRSQTPTDPGDDDDHDDDSNPGKGGGGHGAGKK